MLSINNLRGWLAVACVYTAVCQSQVPEAPPGVQLQLSERISRDDNLYRLADDVDLAGTILGSDAARDDTISRTSLQLDGKWRAGRQTFVSTALVALDRFANNSMLDNSSGNAALDWNWQLGGRTSGEWGARYERSLAGFASSRFLQKDLFSTLDYHAATHFELTPHWRLNWRGRYADASHGNVARRADDFTSPSGVIGLEHSADGGDRIALEYRATQTRFQRVQATPSSRDYDESTASVTVNHPFSAKTTLNLTAGYLEHSYPHAPYPDFSGAVWDAAINWQPTGKTRLIARGYRQLKAYLDVESDYFIARGAVLGAAWQPTAKIAVSLQASRERQQYIAALEPSLQVALRDDRVDIAELNVDYSPRRALSFVLNARAENRDSAEDVLAYDDRSVSLECRFTLSPE